jgi:NO-binding membrane sensor protein with MHYT domain
MDRPASIAPRVSALATLSLLLSAGTALLALAMFAGAGCVQGVEASGIGNLVVRDSIVYHPFFSWAAVLFGGGAQALSLLLALWSRRRIRRSQGRLVGAGVAAAAMVLAIVTLAGAPTAFACGASLAS